MSTAETKKFGRVRSFLWPIHRSEHKKFIPMFLIGFLISFNYNLLRAAKDTMVITAPGSGAEAIPFLKVWVMIPMSILMTFIFTRISNRFDKEKVFYWMIGIFLGFFFLFTFFLYPFREFLHPHHLSDYYQNLLPTGFKGLIALIRNWTFTAFYVMSDLWSSIIFTVLFWGFANDVTSVKEAKRFYALFGVAVNMSGIFSGQAAMYLSSNIYRAYLPYGTTAWEQSVLFLNSTILITGLVIIWIYRWISKHVIRKTMIYSEMPKIKMSVRKNFSYIGKSKYLLSIAVIVVTYNLCINLAEVVWKNQVKELYPNPSEFNIYMGQVMSLMGVIATTTSLFISGYLIRRFSWTSVAMIPPAIMLGTGIFFFGFMVYKDSFLGTFAALLGTTPLIMSVLFGTLQNCLCRASKYTLFDATKEMTFIPLSNECKLKGKAAIDGVGSRIGKSGGSLLHQSLLMIFSTISASTPMVGGIFLGVVAIWSFAVISLGKQFKSLLAHKETIDIPDADKEALLLKQKNQEALS